MKYLILDFKNAGWFQRDLSKYDEKDIVVDVNGKRKRDKQYKEPITPNHVSNMLHVLLGERPAASLRETHIKEIPEIRQIALNGWIKINDFSLKSKKDKVMFFKEKLRTKKAVWDSWDTSNCLLSWNRIKRFLEDDLYNEFIQLLKKIYQVENPTIETLENVLIYTHNNMLDNPDVKDFLNKLKCSGKTPLYNVLTSGNIKNTAFNMNARTTLTINSGVSDIIRLSGQIIVPIEEKWIQKLKNSQGIAKILDGGLVTVRELISEFEFSNDIAFGFTPINTISTELLNK